MKVICRITDIKHLSERTLEAVSKFLRIEGEVQELEREKIYDVFAVERRSDGGLFYYIIAMDVAQRIAPYPAELFAIEDPTLRDDWEIKIDCVDGLQDFRLMTFEEWANDERFFERLCDGGAEEEEMLVYWERLLASS